MKLIQLPPPVLTLIPENDDDIYVLYTFIKTGDIIKAKTSRKIKKEGSDDAYRETAVISIAVEKIEYKSYGDFLRIRGIIVDSSNPDISLSSYHTLTLKPKLQLSIKRDNWDMESIAELNSPSNMGETSLLLLVIDDEVATIAKLGRFATQVITEIHSNLPRKAHNTQYLSLKKEYHQNILETLLDLEKTSSSDKIIIGGPGFEKDEFFDYLKTHAPQIIKKIHLIPIKNHGRNGLRELIAKKELKSFTVVNHAQEESDFLTQFLTELSKENGKAVYGLESIQKAAEIGAIEKLGVLDKLLHGDISLRNKIEEIQKLVKRYSGSTILISSNHPYSNEFEAFGGIVALLRYPLP